MHSSISNSNDRVPQFDWQAVWVIALSIVIIVTCVWEVVWRLQRFEPSLNDDAQLWISVRKAIPKHDRQTMVLIGSSRMQLDVDTQVFKKILNQPTFQLAIDGTSPLSILSHLAADETFQGTVVCDINEANLISKPAPNTADQWIKQYQQSKFTDEFEFLLRAFVQKSFVFRLPELQPLNIWNTVQNEKRLPLPFYLTLYPDRFKAGDYLLLNKYPNYSIAAHYNMRFNRHKEMYAGLLPVDQTTFQNNLNIIKDSVEAIQKRGGKVIFVRFPTSGGVLELDDQYLPRSQYWDVFAQQIPAQFIHFKDHPNLQYNLPDGSHLDFRQAVPFTKNLALLINSLKKEH